MITSEEYLATVTRSQLIAEHEELLSYIQRFTFLSRPHVRLGLALLESLGHQVEQGQEELRGVLHGQQ